MTQYDQSKSMVEIAEQFIRENGKQNIYELMESVIKIKGYEEEQEDKKVRLYIDITMSGNFVYCGNEEWDLKENNLELWDKDGSYFNKDDHLDEDDEDDIDLEDYNIPEEPIIELSDDDDDEDEDDDKLDAKEDEEDIIDDDIKVYSTDDDDDVDIDLDFDDDDYHDIMDDYEDMYDD